eukprot:4142144-Karenia_brevis.AAC.1
MCSIRSGVIQGCPLGATLFIISAEPFVRMLVNRIQCPELGLVRLCADDIAVVLKSWTSLTVLYEIFHVAEECAALVLKPAKCVLVPLSSPLSLHVRSLITQFLSEYLPNWAGFKIQGAA